MKTIICGSRKLDKNEIHHLTKAIELSGFTITEVISGCATGVDASSEVWAKENNIPIKLFPAEWDNLAAPGSIIKINKWGKPYNANAGPYRNSQMIEYAEQMIALPRKDSKGTRDAIKKATAAYGSERVFVYELN